LGTFKDVNLSFISRDTEPAEVVKEISNCATWTQGIVVLDEEYAIGTDIVFATNKPA